MTYLIECKKKILDNTLRKTCLPNRKRVPSFPKRIICLSARLWAIKSFRVPYSLYNLVCKPFSSLFIDSFYIEWDKAKADFLLFHMLKSESAQNISANCFRHNFQQTDWTIWEIHTYVDIYFFKLNSSMELSNGNNGLASFFYTHM